MAIRFYLSDVIGDGLSPSTAFRPAVVDVVPSTVRFTASDDRQDVSLTTGKMLVRADVTLAQHNTLAADARITAVTLRSTLTARIRNRIHRDWEL